MFPQVEKEVCGGPWGTSGVCDDGLYCAERGGVRPAPRMMDGHCLSKWIRQITQVDGGPVTSSGLVELSFVTTLSQSCHVVLSCSTNRDSRTRTLSSFVA